MRPSCFVVLFLVTFIACVTGLAINDDTAAVVKAQAAFSHEVVRGHRNLKGSTIKVDDATAEAENEERIKIPLVSKLVSYFKGNPSIANSVEKNTGLIKTFQRNPGLAKSLDDPKISKQFQALQKDKNLLNRINSDPALNKLQRVIAKNPTGLTEKKVGIIGSFVAKLKAVEVVGDVKGMVIAYGILFLALIGIGTTGAVIYNNTRNSYIVG